MEMTSIERGTQAELLVALSRGSIWVKGGAKATVRRMRDAGLVDFAAQAICDNNTSRSHEEYHVWLVKK